MIDESAMIEAIIQTRQQVDFLWQFFVTVQIAVFALLFIYDKVVESMNAIAKVMAVAGVALFSWINGNALINTYVLLSSMIHQYALWYGKPGRFEPSFLQHFVNVNYIDRPKVVMVTHSLALVVVLIAMTSRHFIRSKHP
jgi:hypothetical protein